MKSLSKLQNENLRGNIYASHGNTKKKTRTAIKILNGKETVGWITVSELKVNYRATVIKTVCYWHTNRHTNQCNSIEEPQISPHIYALLSF